MSSTIPAPSSVPPTCTSAPLPSFRSPHHALSSASPLPPRPFSHSPRLPTASFIRPSPSPSQTTSSHSRSHSNPHSIASTPSSDQPRRSSDPTQAALQAPTEGIELDDFWTREKKNNEMEKLANRYRKEGMGVIEDWGKSCWPNGPGGRRSKREEEMQRGREGIGQLAHQHESMGIGHEEVLRGEGGEIGGSDDEEVEGKQRKERTKL